MAEHSVAPVIRELFENILPYLEIQNKIESKM